MRVIGLMSGTSLDGVDAAGLETDGERVQAFGPRLTVPYPDGLRALLRQVIAGLGGGAAEPGGVEALGAATAEAERWLTELHAAAARRLDYPAELIGFHGQTVLHAPARRVTRQLGDSALLARLTGVAVAGAFRLRDVAAGGQGAPLAPLFHAALAERLEKPLLVVNIGGVANVTFIGEAGIGEAGALMACDTGPGNALLDDFMLARTGVPLDLGGALAQAGRPDEALLGQWLADPFFDAPAPKSLDRQHFASVLASLEAHDTADGAATLAAFTARAVARAPLPARPRRLLVTGGGRHNAAIMRALEAATGLAAEPVEAAGWDGDALEAQCFGFLAARVARGLVLSLPATTGVPRPMPGGEIWRVAVA